MKFSVLIAHYNNWNYFQECYQSILNQTYQDFEIIIVDDYSTDGSYEKLLELSKQDDKIKLFQNSENRKVGFTKRKCIDEASGDICGFLDPDDIFSPTSIEEVVNCYKNNLKIISTYSKIKLINQNSEVIGDFKNTSIIKNGNQLFFNINFEVAHFFTFKKESYLLTDGINPSLIISEDQDLYMKLYEKGGFYFIDKVQYFYRIHDKGISQNKRKTEQQKKDWHKVIVETCKRRNITKLYGKNVESINNLPEYIFKKENTIVKRLIRKFI